MITVKDFQIKTIQDLVEQELFKNLEEFPIKHSITLKSSYACYRDEIIKDLKSRGFTNVTVYEDSYWIIFNFDVDMERKEEKKSEWPCLDAAIKCCCPLLRCEILCEKQNKPDDSGFNDYFDKHRQCNQDETEELIKHYFAEIDEQFKHGNRATLLLTTHFLNDPKPVDENEVHYDIHWYWVMKVLQKRYGYVTMKRLDKDFNSVEEYIESHSRVEVIEYCPKICYFKFFIYKREKYYTNDQNGTVTKLDDLEK